ncbi:MAG: cadmium-translocating P-type ATPase [Oscillospiraceae bacterium]|nr:cadmium-translocating P-type ATPase [Oscillospiraceae bacterium]
MEKVFILKGLDCPHCAGVIERETAKLDGVESASVELMKQTLTVKYEGSAAELLQKVQRIVNEHEPEVEVSEYTASEKDKPADNSDVKKMIARLSIGAFVFVAGVVTIGMGAPLPVTLVVLIAAYFILGWDVVYKAIKNIVKGRVFDENFLMSLSSICAFAIGEYPEAVAVMLFYQIGEFCQSLAVRRSRRSIASLMDIRPDSACVKRNGEVLAVSPVDVEVDEIIVVRPGERIPLDGVVTDGNALLDTRSLTGESVPRSVKAGDDVLSGCISTDGVLEIRVTKPFSESTAVRMIDLVENASARKAPAENFITSFAEFYTPIVVVLAMILAVLPPLLFGGEWSEWLRRGCVFLVVSCPCALVISVPLAFFGGIGAASKHGVLVKGGNYLEALSKVGTVVFDKTGTLTKGVFKVADIVPADGFTEGEVLSVAASAEQLSNHPAARSVLSAYSGEIEKAEEYKELTGLGVAATVGGKKVLAGSAKLMESEDIAYIPCEKAGTKVYAAADGVYVGCILISDEIKPDSREALSALRGLGVEKTVMLTGDDEHIAREVAEELSLDGYYAQLLPQDKVEILERLDSEKRSGSKLVFVGDGINDAPVLARADIGIAMGGIGSDAAIEAADVVLMTDEPKKLAEAVEVAKATKRIVVQNIVIALSIKGVFLALGALGLAGMWEAVFGDVGVALIAVFNSMRILKR